MRKVLERHTLKNVEDTIRKFIVMGYKMSGHESIDLQYVSDGIDPKEFDTVEKAIDSVKPEDFENIYSAYAVYERVSLITPKIALNIT